MKTRYRYDKETGEVWQVATDEGPKQTGPFLHQDLNALYREGGFRSPIDGTWIDSRKSLRAHEQRHGVKQCGELTAQQQIEPLKRSYEQSRAEMASQKGIDFSWTD